METYAPLTFKNQLKFYNNIFSERQPSNFSGKTDYSFLENIIQIRCHKPAIRQSLAHFAKVFAVRIKFFRRACDVTAFATLCIGML